jgi:Ca2+-binding EF-hand superfamily protein
MMERIEYQKENPEHDLINMFRVFDKDEQNCVTKIELNNIFQTLVNSSNSELNLTNDEISEIITYFDHDKDGKMSFNGI